MATIAAEPFLMPRDESDRGRDPLHVADALNRQLVRLLRLMERTRTCPAPVSHPGIERASFVLLAHLVDDGPHRTGALADAVRSDPSTVSRQIATLVRHGLVERRADPADGRACVLAATAEGEGIYHRNRRSRNEHIDRMLTNWPVHDRSRLITLLNRLNTEFENYTPPLTATPPAEHEGDTR